MLDLNHPVALPSLPHLHLYADDEDHGLFYAWSDPRPVSAETSLLTWSRGGVISGGQLSLTTSLALTEAEQAAVRRLLTSARCPLPTLRYPEWQDGQVTVQAGRESGSATATGRPSLLGENRAVLALALSAEQAQQVGRWWKSADNWLLIRYEITLAGRVTTSATHKSATLSVQQRTTTTHPHTVTLQNRCHPSGSPHTAL
jgi:hypothetical protein